MASPVFLASLVTIVPAMAALFWFLRRYEGYFEDARLFFALTVGLFAGLGASAFEFYTNFGDATFVAAAGIGSAFLFFVAGYSFFEAGIKTLVLGLRRFRARKDTPYYGMAFGLGFGAMVGLLVLANAVRLSVSGICVPAPGPCYSPHTLTTFTLLVLLVVGIVFTHGATATWAGKGSADGKLWKGWGFATLFQMPVWGLLWAYWPSLGHGNEIVLIPTVTAVVYGCALLLAAQHRILDRIVPKEIADQVRRERRRALRRANRERAEHGARNGPAGRGGRRGRARTVGAGATAGMGATVGAAAAGGADDAEE